MKPIERREKGPGCGALDTETNESNRAAHTHTHTYARARVQQSSQEMNSLSENVPTCASLGKSEIKIPFCKKKGEKNENLQQKERERKKKRRAKKRRGTSKWITRGDSRKTRGGEKGRKGENTLVVSRTAMGAWQTGDEIKAKEKAHNVAALPNYCD